MTQQRPSTCPHPDGPLASFASQGTVLLTTFRRDGTPVGTPVSIVVDGDRAYVRTYARAGKMKRIARQPAVEVRASTFLGRPTGEPVRARARVLDGGRSRYPSRLLARKHPLLHGLLVPLAHRLRREQTIHLELTPEE